jgi:hypothetical protein
MQPKQGAMNSPDNLTLRGWPEMKAAKTTGYERAL